jgi:hypothetical protein
MNKLWSTTSFDPVLWVVRQKRTSRQLAEALYGGDVYVEPTPSRQIALRIEEPCNPEIENSLGSE